MRPRPERTEPRFWSKIRFAWRRANGTHQTHDYRHRGPGHDVFITQSKGFFWILFIGNKPDLAPGDILQIKDAEHDNLGEIDILDVGESADYESVYALGKPNRWNRVARMANEANVVVPLGERDLYERYLWGAVAQAGGKVTVPHFYLDPENEVPPLFIEAGTERVTITAGAMEKA